MIERKKEHWEINPLNYLKTKDEIEEVNRKMLEKLLEENEFVAVYFCKYSIAKGKHLDYLYAENSK